MEQEHFAILKKAKELSGIEESIDFMPLPEEPFKNVPVLALGRLTRGVRSRVVNAPSPGSLVTKADSLTRMTDALKLLVNGPQLPEMRYIVEERLDWLCGILRNTHGKKVSFDIETSGDVKWDIPSYDQVISVAIWGGTGSVMVIPEHMLRNPLVEKALNKFLRRNKIITANGKFDLSYFEPDLVNWFDIMLAHYALFPAGSTHGLKDLADQYFGSGDWDEGNKQYTVAKTYKTAGDGPDGVWWTARKYSGGSGYERIPRSILYEYNAYDVFYTWFLYELFESYLAEDPESRMCFDWLLTLDNDLFRGVERRGIRLNVTYLQQLEEEMTAVLFEAEAALNIAAGQVINPRSHIQVKAWLHSRKKRVKSSDKDAIEKLLKNPRTSDEVKEFCLALTKCRFISKQLSTYVTGYLKHCHGDMVYPGYKLHAASTGRLGGSGASMLTIPRDKRLKSMVLPSVDGHVVVTADMSQAELRVMAMESGDPWLIAAFQPGAGDIFDILLQSAMPEHDWAELHARADDGDDPGQFYGTWRARMKGVVYGVSFGRGVAAIAAALEVEKHIAQTLVDGFVRPGSKFALWREEIEEKALKGQAIVTKFGRHFQSEIITEANAHEVTNSALSFTSQSTANDICLKAAVWLNPQLAQYGAWLMGTIHDAIYVTCPEEHKVVVGNLIAEALRRAGQEAYGDTVPFAADAGYGPNRAKIEKLAA
jgi:DNA polymerase-1